MTPDLNEESLLSKLGEEATAKELTGKLGHGVQIRAREFDSAEGPLSGLGDEDAATRFRVNAITSALTDDGQLNDVESRHPSPGIGPIGRTGGHAGSGETWVTRGAVTPRGRVRVVTSFTSNK